MHPRKIPVPGPNRPCGFSLRVRERALEDFSSLLDYIAHASPQSVSHTGG